MGKKVRIFVNAPAWRSGRLHLFLQYFSCCKDKRRIFCPNNWKPNHVIVELTRPKQQFVCLQCTAIAQSHFSQPLDWHIECHIEATYYSRGTIKCRLSGSVSTGFRIDRGRSEPVSYTHLLPALYSIYYQTKNLFCCCWSLGYPVINRLCILKLMTALKFANVLYKFE